MAKFKIGDRVKAVEQWDGNYSISGKIGTVIALNGYRYNIGVEFDDNIEIGGHNCGGKGKDGHCWWCPDRILEPAPVVNEKIIITTDGKTTTAKMYDGKTVTKTATAKCSPDDEFNFETGAKIAFERLTGNYTEKSFDWDAFKREKTIVKVTNNNWREFVSEAKKQGLTFCDGAVKNPFEMFFDNFMRAIIAESSILEVKPDEIFIMYEGTILKYSHISEGRTVITW